MTEADAQMYGTDINQYMKSMTESMAYRYGGAGMIVAGILSDCQEMIEHKYDKHFIRKELNKAKHILFSAMQNEIVFAVER